jgi:hypothetical protein
MKVAGRQVACRNGAAAKGYTYDILAGVDNAAGFSCNDGFKPENQIVTLLIAFVLFHVFFHVCKSMARSTVLSA